MRTRVADLSVAIPTINRPNDLARCLDALQAGEVLPSQVVVVDQSVDDQTQSLVSERMGGELPITYVRQDQLGVSASRNAAISRVEHPIVAFTDDDCVPDHGWLEAIERAFASSAAPDAVTGRVLPFGPASDGTFSVSPRESTVRVDFSGKQIPWLRATGGNFALRRAWFERSGMYDERLGPGSPGRAAEDADLFYRLLKAGARFRYEPDAVVYHLRQSRDRRLATRWSYGYGMGAICGVRCREGDLYGVHMLVFWLEGVLRELAGAVARREWLEAHQRLLSLSGAAGGFAYGLSLT
jgi:GT2 family glycosyltransferase